MCQQSHGMNTPVQPSGLMSNRQPKWSFDPGRILRPNTFFKSSRGR